MSPENRRRTAWRNTTLGCLLLAFAAAAAGCGGGKDGDSEKPAPAKATLPFGSADAEFSRRLRLGIDQLRRHLPDSARAEFDACASIRPDDPELLFHQARLELAVAVDRAGMERAAERLRRSAELRPTSVKTHRLLYEVETLLGNREAAGAHAMEIVKLYGQVGLMELASHAAFLQGGLAGPPNIRYPEPQPGVSNVVDFEAFRKGFTQLQRQGTYAPSEAIPALEKLFRDYPDLAAVRIYYAKLLVIGEVRVNWCDRDDLMPSSSKLILDMVQSHLERIFDQCHPGSPIAREAVLMLGHTALVMGDWDESVMWSEFLAHDTRLPEDFRRFVLGREGLARFKQGRCAEAVNLLERSLDGPAKDPADRLSNLWVLHLTHEAMKTPPEKRRLTFRFRPDLARTRGSTPFDFEDIAPRLHLDKYDGLGPAAWADYDHDGDFDVCVGGHDSYGALFRNDGDVFTDVSREAGLFRLLSGYSTTFADCDNDGWPDLYVGRDGWNGPMVNSLYRNRGDGTFVEVTDKAGLGNPGSTFVHQWTDVDRDGDLDLYMANGITGGGDTNALYRNNGDGTFTDVTEATGLLEPRGTKTIGVAVGDYDNDGWPDFFVSGFNRVNRLYRNRGDGTFEEVAGRAGVSSPNDLTRGYVCFFFDYDNDLDLDILRTTLAQWTDVLLGLSDLWDGLPEERRRAMLVDCPRLYRNEGNGTFTDVTVEAGFVYPVGIMGAGVADLDNDGYIDVYFGTGDPGIERMEADRFFRNNGDGTFSEVTFAAGLGNTGKGHGVTFIDLDGDGDLEIFAQEGGFVHGDMWANAFYLNRQKTGNHWFQVDLEGKESNRDALDTRLVIHAGGRRFLREAHSGDGFGCTNAPTIPFGLGTAERVERLEVRWPSGKVQTFEDLPVDRRYFLREGEAPIERGAKR